MRKDVNPIN